MYGVSYLWTVDILTTTVFLIYAYELGIYMWFSFGEDEKGAKPIKYVIISLVCLLLQAFWYAEHHFGFPQCRSPGIDQLMPAPHPKWKKKKKTLWAVHHHLVRQAGYLLPALRSVLCLRLKLMLYPPQVVNISESKHDALKKVQRSWFPRFVFGKTKTIQFKIIRRESRGRSYKFWFLWTSSGYWPSC